MLTNIQEELQQLETERTELELHIEQTDSWTENLGVWQCRVHQVVLSQIIIYFELAHFPLTEYIRHSVFNTFSKSEYIQ